MLSIKLLRRGKALTPYVSVSHTNGASQKRFAETYGHRAGACVKAGVHKGMTQQAIRDVVRGCAR
jgi:hypothetical protein